MFKKKILPIIIFVLLLGGMAYFPYIPLKIFNLDYENFSQLTKVIYTLVCDIGYMLVVFFLYKNSLIKNFKDYFKNISKNFEISFKYYFIGLIVMIVSNLLITLLIPQATAGNEDAVRTLIDKYPLYMLFSVSIYAPFIEEIIFRKSIKDIVLSFGDNKICKYIYIFISGSIFALMHILGVATSTIDYIFIIPYLGLGIAFAALYDKTNNIVSTMSVHCIHNTLAVILYLVGVGI